MTKSLRILSSLVIVFLLLALGFSASLQRVEAQIYGSNWNATFFNSTDLSGTAVFTRTDAQINFNFGTGSPDATVNPDNFSARWTGTQQFAAATYRFTLRYDDGARLIIDGTTIIDDFNNNGSERTSTADVILTEGNHTITVEYVEFSGNAVIQLFWEQLTAGTQGPTATPTITPLPAIPPGALTATVIRAGVLNVRDAPSLGGNVISQILRGQTYQIVGRNENATWFLLQLNEFQGWAYGYYLFVNGNEFNAPIRAATTVYALPAGFNDTGVLVQVRATMRMRAEPNVFAMQTGRITWGAFLPVSGRTAAGDWFQVLWKGTIGWVYTGFLEIVQGDYDDIPVIQ